MFEPKNVTSNNFFITLQIPGGMINTATPTVAGSLIISTANRVCGRFFNPAAATAINAPVCSKTESLLPMGKRRIVEKHKPENSRHGKILKILENFYAFGTVQK